MKMTAKEVIALFERLEKNMLLSGPFTVLLVSSAPFLSDSSRDGVLIASTVSGACFIGGLLNRIKEKRERRVDLKNKIDSIDDLSSNDKAVFLKILKEGDSEEVVSVSIKNLLAHKLIESQRVWTLRDNDGFPKHMILASVSKEIRSALSSKV
jgi:predicted transcriptional regulator